MVKKKVVTKKTPEIAACPDVRKFKLSQLKPAAYNPRVISEENLAALVAGLQRFGCVEPLSAAQIKELGELEKLAKKTTKKKVKKTKKNSKSRRRLPTQVAVKAAGQETEDYIAAEQQLGLSRPLADVLAKHKKLKAAFERGRFLKNIKELAATAITAAETEEKLELEPGQLAEMFEADVELRDCWNQERLRTIIEVKTAMVAAAKDGKPSAAKQVEAILRREIVNSGLDTGRITIEQMTEITAKTRQTIHAWYSRHGCPRNSDKTFNLTAFLGWFEEFCTQKTRGSKAIETDPFKARKTEKLELEIARQRGQLLDRSIVIAGFLARWQGLVNATSHKSDDLGMTCGHQPAAKIAETLEEFFAQLRGQMCQIPEELRLSKPAAEKLKELLEMIEPEGN